MPLIGPAAMLLSFDVAEEAIADHDDWHTHEHLPERLAIPGFLRGTRWVVVRGQPRYLVLYEVAGLDVLGSAPYLARLDQPSAWTTRVMPHYRGMSRGFCTVTASFGLGVGGFATLLRFKPDEACAAALRRWLAEEALPGLAARPGLAGAHLLEGAATPSITNEQRLRGADAGLDWALIVTGYEQAAVAELEPLGIGAARLGARGAVATLQATYRLHCTAARDEVRDPLTLRGRDGHQTPPAPA